MALFNFKCAVVSIHHKRSAGSWAGERGCKSNRCLEGLPQDYPTHTSHKYEFSHVLRVLNGYHRNFQLERQRRCAVWAEEVSYMYDKGTFTCAERTRAENWLQTQIITCAHTCAVAERSGSKIYSATNGSTPHSKPSLSSRNGRSARALRVYVNLPTVAELRNRSAYIEGILPKGPYLPCVSMADRALLAGYPRY